MPPLSFSFGGMMVSESTITFPAYIGISNTNTPLLLSSITFMFMNRGTGSYAYDYLGDPIIEYSDDGTTWTPIPTTYSLGENVNYKYTAASGPAPAYYTGAKSISISQYSHSTKHSYWRVAFQSGSLSSRPWFGIFIPEITWLDPSSTQLFYEDTNFGESDLDSLQWAQSENVLYVTSGTNKKPMSITYNNGALSVADFEPQVGGQSIWETHGFPACVSVFQNRLCFAGFNEFRGRVVMSKFGDFDDYTVPSPITSLSPIVADSLQLTSRIDFLWAGDKALYGLSAEGVSMIDAGGGVIATDQIEFQLRNREPAAGILPTVKDDIMVYVGRNLQKIMVTDFDFVVQRYRAVVLSNTYDNFLQSGIKSIHYVPTKARLIYGLLNDGKGFMLLFDQPSSKNSVYPFSIAGSMSDILPIKYKDTTKLLVVASYNNTWCLVQKDAQPEVTLMDFMSDSEKKSYTDVFIKQNVFLDYYTIYDLETEIDGFPCAETYRAGEEVETLIDGNYVGLAVAQAKELHKLESPDFGTEYYVADIEDGAPVWEQDSSTGNWSCNGTLTVSGNDLYINSIEVNDTHNTLEVAWVELEEPSSHVIYGIKYDSYLAIKLVSPYMIRKFPREVAVNFINTGYVELGNTFGDLRPALDNIVDNITLDNNPMFVNGNYEKTLDKQAFETPYVIIRSDKGLPFSVTGIDYEVDYSNYQGGV